MTPGPKEKIALALTELLGATDRPPSLDEEKAAARVIALRQTAWDYPIDVVERACRNWRKVPKHGGWWPNEQDLRAQCEPLVALRRNLKTRADRLLGELEAKEAAQERAQRPSPFAGDAHRAFREVMRSRLADHRYRAYFNTGHIQYAGERLILVRTEVAESVLNEEGADVIAQYDLEVRCDRHAFAGIYAPEEEMTPAKHAWVAERMTRLNAAMRANGNIKAMIREGYL